VTPRATKQRIALAGLLVLAGAGLASLLSPLIGTALATVGQVVNISDHSASANFAKVTAAGELRTNAVVSGKVATAAPPSPWRASVVVSGTPDPGVLIAGPSASPINVTSLTASTAAPSGFGPQVGLVARHVPASATNCNGAAFDATVWHSLNAGGPTTPLSVSFPTPLQYKPPANTKACLFALATSSYTTEVSASGFYG